MNNKGKRLILKNAIIALINVLHSIISEAIPYFSEKEEAQMTITKVYLDKTLQAVNKQVTRIEMRNLESRTDVDYRIWVQSQAVSMKNIKLFEAEFKELIRKYS